MTINGTPSFNSFAARQRRPVLCRIVRLEPTESQE
jgi:hypothetical protein